MSTEFFNDQWRIPSNENQNKISNYSIDFDGTSDFININSLASSLGSQGSFSAWVNVSDWSTRAAILGFAFDADNFLRFGVRPNNNNCFSIGGQFNNVANEVLSDTTSLSENVWYHIVATSDGSVYKLYVNGQLQTLTILAGSNNGDWVSDFSSTANKGTIGSLNRTGPSEDLFSGKIDQVTVFNYALSQDQVTQLGAEGYAFNFNGSTQAIDCGAGSRFDIDQITISGWVNLSNSITSTLVIAGIRNTNNGFICYHLQNAGATSKFRFVIVQEDGTYADAIANDIHQYNTWYHVVGVADGSNVKLYVNGVPQTDTGTYDGTIKSPTQNFNIGRQPSNPLYYWDGELSNISVFNTGLQESDVQTLYNSGKPLTDMSSFTSLQGWWKLDNTATFNSGTSVWTIPDDSSNSNNGLSVGPMTSSSLVASDINGELIANPMITSPKPIAYYQLGDQSVSTGPTSDYLVPNNSLSDYVFDFDGVNSNRLINLGNSFNYPSVVSDPWTISFWVKPTDTASEGVVFSGYSVANNRGFYVNMRDWPNPTPGDRRLQCIIRSDNPIYTSVVTPSLALNEWTHVAVCYGGGGSGSFPYSFIVYFNNSPVSLVVAGGNLGTAAGSVGPNDPKYIGNLGSTLPLENTELSELSFFKYKLSPTQVETVYNNGAPGDISSLSPFTSYKLNASEVFNSTSTEWSVDNNAYPSVYESSLDFNGTSDYLDTPQIDLGSTNTISFWINNSVSNSGTIFGDPNTFSTTYAIAWGTATNVIVFRLGNGDSGFWQLTVSSGLLQDGNWHHHCLSRDGVAINYYIDGALQTNVTNNTLDASAGTNTSIENIMARSNGTSFASGKLSNVSFFSTALTGPQVETLYNNGTPEAAISHSPTSWYKLNNTTTGIQDSAGSNNGTNNGATEYVGFVNALAGESVSMDSSNLVVSDLQKTSGYSPYALDFDGTNDYLNCGGANDFSFTNGSGTDLPFSLSAWINMDDASGFRIITKYGTGTDVEWFLYTTGSDILRFRVYDKNNASYIGRGYGTPLTSYQNKWINVVATYNGNKQNSGIKLYINGFKVDDQNASTGTYQGMVTTTNPVTIGKMGTVYANGKISNASIFNTELSSAEVTEIYNSGVPGNLHNFSGTAPISWWQIGSNSSYNSGAWTCLDEIGSNNAVSGSGMTNGDIVDGPGYSASGLGTSSIDILGDAPYSSANGLSENMDVLDRTLDSPITNTHSIQLDGVDGAYVDFGNVNIFERTDAFSGSCWINLAPSASTGMFISKSKNSTIVGYQFYVTATRDVIFFIGDFYSNNYLLARTVNTINASTWYNVAFTYSGSSARTGIKLYVNGVPQSLSYQGPTSITGSIVDSSVPFQISGRDGANLVLDGKIDEVAMFNSELSAPQVASIYNNGTPGNILPLNPVSWHRFESLTTSGGVVTTADSSVNGLTGTVENGAVLSTIVP
ncbi:LamG domain-containing protein [Flavobacteriaceae bacterium]|nr:LamG domain-containing protein [Flavobacteriaceae bacterium]